MIQEPFKFYRDILPILLEAKTNEEAKVGLWAPSEIEKGTSRNAFLCCNENSGTRCEPFPRCCDCKSKHHDQNNIGKMHEYDTESNPTTIPLVEILQN